MGKISRIWSREILDSRGLPTLETAIVLDNGVVGVASVPSGTSTGKHEAHELRDGDQKRYLGKGVLKAVENVNGVLNQNIRGFDIQDQGGIDKKLIALDGSENKDKIGANAILSVSLAAVRAGAILQKLALYKYIASLSAQFKLSISQRVPTPIFNMINGGLHGAGNLDFQEFHVIPASTVSYSTGLERCVTVYHNLRSGLERRGAIHSVGDEGGFAPNLFTNIDALSILVETIAESGFAVGRDLFLGLDVAASTFFKDGKYHIRDRSTPLDTESFVGFFTTLNEQFHLALIEDPMGEDDWEGWKKIAENFSGKVLVVGDDLLATNPQRVKQAIDQKACNAILVKPNQIGTISETLGVIAQARGAGWKVITSHRSGETNDTFIADFAVGVGSDFVKFGAPARGERVAKYNRLLAIESELSIGK